MRKPRLFVGSSTSGLAVAREVANQLEAAGCGSATGWKENVFLVGAGTLDTLAKKAKEFDCAVFIWSADDTTESRGEASASPRDNVIFECGLFMGVLGRDRVFVVCDEKAHLKIPSDFAGITLAMYDGDRVTTERASAVREACDTIADTIRALPHHFDKLVGRWVSRYAETADRDHMEVIDEVDVDCSYDRIILNSAPNGKAETYVAKGSLYGNQLVGEWEHWDGGSLANGRFMLVVGPLSDVMYGYCTGRDANGSMVFDTWVLVRKAGIDDAEVHRRLSWGEKTLLGNTLTLPPPKFEDEG